MNQLIKLKDIPNLEEDYEPNSVDLSFEYWTPEEEGERKRVIFWEIATRTVPDHQDANKIVDLPCAVFIQPDNEGGFSTVANGSRRLVALFENSEIEQGTPVQVTYKGKAKNRTNSNMSDRWSVVTLGKKGE